MFRVGVRLVRSSGEKVASPGVVVANVTGFPSVRALRFFEFISSIRFSPMSSVRQRTTSYSYVSRSSRIDSSIRYKCVGSLSNKSRR